MHDSSEFHTGGTLLYSATVRFLGAYSFAILFLQKFERKLVFVPWLEDNDYSTDRQTFLLQNLQESEGPLQLPSKRLPQYECAVFLRDQPIKNEVETHFRILVSEVWPSLEPPVSSTNSHGTQDLRVQALPRYILVSAVAKSAMRKCMADCDAQTFGGAGGGLAKVGRGGGLPILSVTGRLNCCVYCAKCLKCCPTPDQLPHPARTNCLRGAAPPMLGNLSPAVCEHFFSSYRKQWMLQQHMKTSHGATSPVQCKVCSDSFASVTELQSHLVRTHSSVLGARSVCNKVHRQALNGAHRHRKAAHRNGVVRSNSQQPETSTARRESKPTPGSGNRSVVKKRVSNGRIRHKKADHATGSDRTMLGPDIDRSSEVEPRSPVNHQIVCSPDSTTDALGNTNSIAGARDPAEENSADSSEEPRWYLGAPDGAMEEMDVSYEQETNGRKSSVSDSASQGTLDMDDVDVTSEVDSPVSHSCAGEVPLKPSSTTHSGALLHQFPERAGSPSVIRIGSTPATSPAPGSEFDSTAGNTASIGRRSLVPADGEHSPVADSVISIGSTPVASPTVLTTPCSPSGSIVDDASFATTEAASDSVPVTPGSPNNGRILDDPELLYGQCNDSCEGSITGPKAAACPRRSAASSDSDDSEILIRPRDKQRRRLARALRRQQAAVAGSPERPRGLTLSPDKPGVDSPLRVREQPSDPEEQGTYAEVQIEK